MWPFARKLALDMVFATSFAIIVVQVAGYVLGWDAGLETIITTGLAGLTGATAANRASTSPR